MGMNLMQYIGYGKILFHNVKMLLQKLPVSLFIFAYTSLPWAGRTAHLCTMNLNSILPATSGRASSYLNMKKYTELNHKYS